MLLSDISVKRPVLATVISVVLVVFGVISYLRLPLREYPDIERPIISISTTYTGASANVVETRITKMLESGVSGISGLKSIQSSSEDGRSNITLEFSSDVDINEAANDVRDKVARVASRLPDEADTPRISKSDSNNQAVLIMGLFHPHLSTMDLTDYTARYLVDALSVVDGVSEVRIFGERRYSMRVWLDRKAMAARGITSADVESTLRSENVELPAGRLESLDREFVMRVERMFSTPEEFAALVLREGSDGYMVRLGDIARVEVGPSNLRTTFTANGKNAIALAVSKQSTANTLTVINGIKRLLPELYESLPPGMELVILRDDAVFIEAAVNEVLYSLLIAAALVVLIIFIFLGNVRAALIPAVTVPISLISAFIVLYWMGYSVNLLTLLALVLAIGLVVDDSIVVLENIHRRIEDGEKPLVAAYRGAREVGFAVIATTMVLVAVFMPITLIEGDTGKLFTEFAVAIVAAVCFSSLVALTLSPMMCGRLLQTRSEEGWLTKLDEAIFGRLERWYELVLHRAMRAPFALLAAFLLTCGAGWMLYEKIPAEFEPQEDRAALFLNMTAPEGSGFDATSAYMEQVRQVPFAMRDEGKVENVMVRVPGSFNSLGAVNNGMIIMRLPYWHERTITATEIANELYAKTANIPGVRISVFQPSGLSGSRGQPVQFVLGGSTYEELMQWRDIILEEARKYPGLLGVDADYKETMPQQRIIIDRDRANKLGVPASVIGQALETMFGSKTVTTYIDNGEEYDVILQARDEDRRLSRDLDNVYVRSSRTGELIPLSNLLTLEEQADSGRLNRFNRVRAITISGSVAEGYTLGECLDYLERIVRERLPATTKIYYSGMSQTYRESSSSMLFVFLLSLVIVYLVLAGQFESFASPLVIMLTVPLGLIGALLGLYLFGATLNIYSQIGLVMLIGLAAKNGILIVEFTNQLRDRGLDFDTALFQAARQRLRPIMMTGLSTAFGALPLVFASGAGKESRLCLGAVIFFGAISACVLTTIVVPIGYRYLARRSSTPQRLARELAEMGIE